MNKIPLLITLFVLIIVISGILLTYNSNQTAQYSSACTQNLYASVSPPGSPSGGKISVIDTNTYQVINSIPLGNIDLLAVACNQIYAQYFFNGTLSVINPTTDKISKTINIGAWPFRFYLIPNQQKLYITTSNNSILVINTKDNVLSKTIQGPPPPISTALRYEPIIWTLTFPQNSHYAYATSDSYLQMLAINTSSDSISKNISYVNDPAFQFLSTPNKKDLFVTYFYNKTMIVMNSTTNLLENYIQLGDYPNNMEMLPDGSKIFIAMSKSVVVIDPTTRKMVNSINTSMYGSDDMRMTSDGKQLYVIGNRAGYITVINTSTETIVKTINVGHKSLNLEMTPNNKQVYVISYDGNVSVINAGLNSLQNLTSVKVYEPFEFLPAPNGKEIYVLSNADQINSTILFLNTSTGKVDKTINNIQYIGNIEINGTFT